MKLLIGTTKSFSKSNSMWSIVLGRHSSQGPLHLSKNDKTAEFLRVLEGHDGVLLSVNEQNGTVNLLDDFDVFKPLLHQLFQGFSDHVSDDCPQAGEGGDQNEAADFALRSQEQGGS